MLNRIKKLSILSLSIFSVTVLLSACGGGSSSGSSSSGSDSESVLEGDTRSAGTGIRLLNGALDSTPVDLRSNLETAALTTTRFSLPAGFARVSQTAQSITVVPTKQLAPRLFEQVFELQKNERHTILIYGNNESIGLRTSVIPDSRPAELAKDQSALRVIHAVNRALTLEGILDGSNFASSVPFGGASTYTTVSSGTHTVTITRSADSTPIFSGGIELQGGKSYSIFATGEVSYLTTVRVLED